MQNTNCPSERDFLGLLSGEMTEAAADAALQHLDECASCEETFRNLEAMDDTQFELDLKQPDDTKGEKEYEEAIERLKLQTPVQVGPPQPAAEKATPSEQRQIGSYRLEKELGRGGMGVVYKATHTHLDKTVAIKLMPAHIADNEALRLRFEQEMKAVGRLDHPNIVRALDAGHADGQSFLSMEYVAGRDIASLLKGAGTLKIADACEIVRQAAVGMQYAHSRGLVHRDLKPANLMLTSAADATAGVVKVLDLGLALIDDRDDELTPTGQIMGTLDYVAPEQVINTSAVDIRADIYSLGATLYKLLTGHAPLALQATESPIEKLAAIQEDEPAPLGDVRAEISQPLAELVHSMLAKAPADRPESPAEVAEALVAFTQDADLATLIESQTGHAAKSPLPVAPRRIARGANSSRQRAKRRWIALGLSVALLLAFVVVIQTDRGTVTIQATPELGKDLQVTVLRDGKPVIEGWQIQTGDKTRTVRSGRIEVRLPADRRDKFVVSTENDQLQLERGGQLVFTITRAAAGSDAVPKKASKPPKLESGLAGWSPDLPKEGWLSRLSALSPARVEGDLGSRVKVEADHVDIDAKDAHVKIQIPLPANREQRIGSRFAIRAELEIVDPVIPQAIFMIDVWENQHLFQSTYGCPFDGTPGWKIQAESLALPNDHRIVNLKRIEPKNPGRVTFETVFLGDELQQRLDGEHLVAAKSIPMQTPGPARLAVRGFQVRVRRFDIRVLSDEEAARLKTLPAAPEYRPLDFNQKTWLEFDGIDDYVQGPVMDGEFGPFTAEMWVKLAEPPNFDGARTQIFSWSGHSRMVVRYFGVISFPSFVRGHGITARFTERRQPVHLAQTFDGKTFRFFVNGRWIAADSDYPDDSKKENDLQEPRVTLGASFNANGELFRAFKGKIYSLRLSRGALYKHDFYPPATFSREKETVVLYTFHEAEGNVLHDSSGNGYDAEIHGATWSSPQTSKSNEQ